MQVIEVLRIDQWDGGDRHNFGFYFKKENATKENLKKWKDSHCLVSDELIVIFDTVEEIHNNSTENLRKTALAKLSPLEKKALGLRD